MVIIQAKDLVIDNPKQYATNTSINGIRSVVIDAPIKAKQSLAITAGTLKVNAPIHVDGLLMINSIIGEINADIHARYIGLSGSAISLNKAKLHADNYIIFDIEEEMNLGDGATIKAPKLYAPKLHPDIVSTIPTSLKVSYLDLNENRVAIKGFINELSNLGPIEAGSVAVEGNCQKSKYITYNIYDECIDSTVHNLINEVLAEESAKKQVALLPFKEEPLNAPLESQAAVEDLAELMVPSPLIEMNV